MLAEMLIFLAHSVALLGYVLFTDGLDALSSFPSFVLDLA